MCHSRRLCFFQNALFALFCPCVPAHRRPGRSQRSRIRSNPAPNPPRAINLGTLFRSPSPLHMSTEINFDTEAVTPGVDPATLVTSSFITHRHAGGQLDDESGNIKPVSEGFKAHLPNKTWEHFDNHFICVTS